MAFVLLFAVYAATACRTVGPGDSGELTVAMSTWGIPHAPGYPLLTLIGNLVSHLPFPGEPAFPLNLMTSLFAALACAAIAATVSLATGHRWPGFVAALALGTSRPFWRYALVTEVFAFNALMAALILLCLVTFWRGLRDGRPAWHALSISVVILSTAITHHPTLLLVGAPATLVVAFLIGSYLRRGGDRTPLVRALKQGALLGCIALLVVLYIPIAAHFEPSVTWGDVHDPRAMFDLLLRKDFGSGTLMAPSIVITRLLENGESVNPLPPRHWLIFWSDLPRSFGWLFPALALAGVWWTALRARALLALALACLGSFTLFFIRVNTPVLPIYLGVTERMYILPHVVLAFYAGLGVDQAMAWVERAHRRAADTVGIAATLGTGAVMLLAHWRLVDMRTNTFTRDFGANLMAGLPRSTLVLSSGDLFTNSLAYAQDCLGLRTDVTVVSLDLLHMPWYRRQLARRGTLPPVGGQVGNGAEVGLDSRTTLDLLRRSPRGEGRNVVVLKFSDDDYKVADRLLPVGIWSRVTGKDSLGNLDEWVRASAELARAWDLRSLDSDYAETSWERSEMVFYVLGIARMRELEDLGRMLSPARTPSQGGLPRGPSGWEQAHRADLLAYRADFLSTCIADSLLPRAYRADPRVAERALALARASLAIDPQNVVALDAMVGLMSVVPAIADPPREALLRSRIVERRPGDLAELVPFLELVLRLDRDPRTRDPALDREAREAQSRFLRLLELASKIDDRPEYWRLRREWSAPLEEIPALR